MVDIENYIITRLEEAIHAEYPNAVVLGDLLEELAEFPTVTVNEIQNETLRRMQDDEPVEHYARVTYEVNIYTNLRYGRKEEAKSILGIIDSVMFPMKFVRRSTRRLPDVDHSRTIYRLYARYSAVVDEGTVTAGPVGATGATGETGETVETITYHTYRG